MLKAVIFDLDGVITDSAAYHYAAWKALADRMNIPFDKSYNEKLKGVSRMESLNLILDNAKGRDAYPESMKEELATEKNEIYKEMIKAITKKDLLPGIEELLKDCKKRNIKVALASASKNAPEIIKRLEIGHYFDYMADASSIKRSKPYPDIFLNCAENLNEDPAECCGIEDSEAGIDAINTAGMLSVGVGSTEKMKKADLILKGTEELSLDPIIKMLTA